MDEEDFDMLLHYTDNPEIRGQCYYFGDEWTEHDYHGVAEALVARWCGLDEQDTKKTVIIIP